MIELSWAVEGPRPISDEQALAALEAALEHGGRPGLDLSVVFVPDDELTRLHAEHLDDPTPTDVITFDLGDDDDGPAGELYLSVERARQVAESHGGTWASELTLYLVHGALHLCGYDDHEEGERRAMRRAEWTVMERLGYALDAARHEGS